MPENDFERDELKLIIDTGRDHYSQYLKSVAIYFGFFGVVVSLFFNAPSNSEKQIAFYLLGVVLNLSAVFLTIAGGHFYMKLAKRCDTLCRKLNIPNLYFPGALAVSKGILILFIIVSVLWLGLIGYIL